MPQAADIIRLLPEIILTIAGTAVMVLAPLRVSRRVFGYISGAALALALLAALNAGTFPGPAFSGLIMADRFATFFRVLVMAVGILTVLSSAGFLRREGAETGEYHALLLFAITGQSVMAASNDLDRKSVV